VLGIIGGSGLSALANLQDVQRRIVRTPYGEPSCALTIGTLRGRVVVFLARHGYGHTILPHQVNYRANLWALREQQVDDVVAIASVGSIRPDLEPGALVVPHQILDYTHGRESTYATGEGRSVRHIDFTEPYCAKLRRRILRAAAASGCHAADGATYAATQGPRLETAAEIDRLERDGADIVGMTGMPEAALARELGLCYAALAVVVNPAAGRGASRNGVRMEEINAVSRIAMERVRTILESLVEIDGD
jgi:5'-methylthioadenosine phosphorylase